LFHFFSIKKLKNGLANPLIQLFDKDCKVLKVKWFTYGLSKGKGKGGFENL